MSSCLSNECFKIEINRRNRADERNKRQTGRKKEKKEERKEGRKEAKIKKKCHDVGDRGEKNSGEQGRR